MATQYKFMKANYIKDKINDTTKIANVSCSNLSEFDNLTGEKNLQRYM